MKLKKWLSAIFAVVMVMSLLPAAALAAEGTGDEVSSEQPTSSVTEVEGSTAPSSEVKTEGEGDELEGQGTEPSEGPVLPQAVNSASVEPTADDDVAQVGNNFYSDLQTAVDAAANTGDTVTLLKGVMLDKMLNIATDGITLDLNGKTITASENFTSNWSNGNDSHLVQVLDATGVTIKNGTIETTAKNKHAVNIYGAEVTLGGPDC